MIVCVKYGHPYIDWINMWCIILTIIFKHMMDMVGDINKADGQIFHTCLNNVIFVYM